MAAGGSTAASFARRKKIFSAMREPVAFTTRRSFAESGLRNGEQTIWWTLHDPFAPRSISLTELQWTSPPRSTIEAGGGGFAVPRAILRSQLHSCSN